MELPRAAPRPAGGSTPSAPKAEPKLNVVPVEGPRPAERALPPPPMFHISKADDEPGPPTSQRHVDPDEAPTGLRELSSPYGGDVSEPQEEPATRLRAPSYPRADGFKEPPPPEPPLPEPYPFEARPIDLAPPAPRDSGAAHDSQGRDFEQRPPEPRHLEPKPTATEIFLTTGEQAAMQHGAMGAEPMGMAMGHGPEHHEVARVIPHHPPPPMAPPASPWQGTDTGESHPRFEPPRPNTGLPVGTLAFGALAALVVVLGLGGGVAWYLKSAHPAPPSSASVAVTSSPSAASTSTAAPPASTVAEPAKTASEVAEVPSAHAVAPVTSSTSEPTAPAPAGSDEEQAKAALDKLRQGIETCVSKKIHVLPGTSPPVPDGLAWLKHGPYASLKRDWVGPFFSCTAFRLEAPMPFMIQWQVVRPKGSGTAVVWLDDDHDGKADRAFGFTAHWKERDVVTFDPVGPLPPTRPIARR